MNPVVEKILESGLIDKTVVAMMEKSGALPEGSSEKVKESLTNASRAVLRDFTDELYELISKEHDKAAQLRETLLDLRTLRWPVDLSIQAVDGEGTYKTVGHLRAMVDTGGHYYARIQDIGKNDIVPGFHLVRYTEDNKVQREMVLETREMYLDDKPVCYLITTGPMSK